MASSFLRRRAIFLLPLLAVSALSAPSRGDDRNGPSADKLDGALKALVIDGSCVQYAGNLQMNVTNFGFLGSMPNRRLPMSDFPSAQWPAGSGVEYLYAAGIWFGAEKTGVPSVSTGYPETEFYPPEDPIDVIYKGYEGAKGGGNYPGKADDDGDGRANEDWLNGRDDDGDGKIDEDYAALGNLMYSCWYTDDQANSTRAWPEHTPLHVRVRQETFQWSERELYNFVGTRYIIENQGDDFLNAAYVGIYADLDAGPRNIGNYFRDDQIATWEGIWCARRGDAEIPVRFTVVYVRDADGDGGKTPGYFGLVFLGCWLRDSFDPTPVPADISGMEIFAGQLPFEHGGEPVNDYERYAALSKGTRDPDTTEPNDYRVLLSLGPIATLAPGSTIEVHAAWACGEGLTGLLDAAASAALVYRGIWYDLDRRHNTGLDGRETPMPGPTDMIDPDACDGITQSIRVRKGDTLWVNADCAEEEERYNYTGCYRGNLTFQDYQTGIDGKEAEIHWIASTAPPAPAMRAIAGDGTVTLFWDNLSEIARDAVTLQNDFEGYQIWRADDWHRPLGTTAETGPSGDLWHLVATRDLVNGLAPDAGFKKPYAAGGLEYEPLAHLENREELLAEFEAHLTASPLDTVPCPAGITASECDTLEALARWNLGLEGGRQYYMFIDSSPKNGMPYFYAVVAYDHLTLYGRPDAIGERDAPISNFVFVEPRSNAQAAGRFDAKEVYVVPNPATSQRMAPWQLEPNNADPSGEKIEFRNLPKCRSTVRIFTVAGDLVQTLYHDGSGGNGTLAWNLVSRNGQTITSGVYLFNVEPEDGTFVAVTGKFVVIR